MMTAKKKMKKKKKEWMRAMTMKTAGSHHDGRVI